MKYRFQVQISHSIEDITPLFAGMSATPPNHTWGPGHVKYATIHRVLSGRGRLFVRGNSYHLQEGDAFIVMPGEVAKWEADETDPWSYKWVGFAGKIAGQFNQLPTVFKAPDWMFAHVTPDIEEHLNSNLGYLLAGDLLHLYGTLVKPQDGRQDYIMLALDFIQQHFAKELTIQMIADHVGLNRDYFARLFKQKTGRTLQDYIMDTRTKEAQRLMYLGYSIKEAALHSGFKDPSNFSKRYKKEHGVSPKQWKAEIHDPNSVRKRFDLQKENIV